MEYVREVPLPRFTTYGIEFFHVACEGETVTAHAHLHPAVEFILIEQGMFDIHVEQSHFTAHTGDLLLYRSNTVHRMMHTGQEKANYYVLKIDPALLFRMFPRDSMASVLPFLRSTPSDISLFPPAVQSGSLRRLWQEMIDEYHAEHETFYAMQRFLACAFLLTCARCLFPHEASKEDSPTVDRHTMRLIYESIYYIGEHFASPLTAVECAARLHLSYSHYAKLFRSVTGKSFKTYLSDLRLTHAYELLFTSSASISEIAPLCGYESLSHFIAEFKRRYGAPPLALRRLSAERTV